MSCVGQQTEHILEATHDAVVLQQIQLHLVLREEGYTMAPLLQLQQQPVQQCHLAAGCHKIFPCITTASDVSQELLIWPSRGSKANVAKSACSRRRLVLLLDTAKVRMQLVLELFY